MAVVRLLFLVAVKLDVCRIHIQEQTTVLLASNTRQQPQSPVSINEGAQQSFVESIDRMAIETIFETAQGGTAGHIGGTKCTGKAWIMKKFVVVVEVFISRCQSQKTLLKHQFRGIQRIAFGGNGIGQNFLGGLKEVKTASDMSDGKKAGKCSRVKFFAGKRDGAIRFCFGQQ